MRSQLARAPLTLRADSTPVDGLLAGVTSYDISLEKQEVTVNTAVDYETILAKIKKTGKEVKSGEVVAPTAV